MGYAPLTDQEAALLYVTTMYGSESYPIRKASGHWYVGPWQEWKGFPTSHRTKKAAVAQFEGWAQLARARFADMRAERPNLILTAVGLKG